MGTKRIEYLDYLKGLSIIWVVWYHTANHPEFVNYSFRIPLFFFVSGIFFRPYPIMKFIKKKINTLVIPFILFYFIYYLFYIILWFAKYNNLSDFDFSCFFQIFDSHKGYENFTINPPLWFICALINLQILLYLSVKIFRKKIYIALFALFMTSLGVLYSFKIPTPFMFGRSLNYFIYYTAGYLIGARISTFAVNYSISTKSKLLVYISLLVIITCITTKNYGDITDLYTIKIINYIETFAIIISLMFLFNKIYQYKILAPFKFYGVNSYIVLGMHEIFHTTNYILFRNIFGEVTTTLGIIQTIITLIMLWPTIILFNKYIPQLVGKKPVLTV